MCTVRFVQLTDTHVSADPALQHGVDTTRTFQAVAAAVSREDPPPDFVLVTGDLVNDARPESYERLRELLGGLPCPVHLAMGNHDDRRALRRIVLGEASPDDAPFRHTFRVNGVTFLVLDSFEAGTSAGVVDARQLEWLDAELRRCEGAAVVVVHHPPVATGVTWLDHLMLENGDELVSHLRGVPALALVLSGHIHRVFETTIDRAPLLTAPSTCYQFSARPDAKEVSGEAPGYRVVTITDGRVTSEVKRVGGIA